ncbi:hypothetical protein [Megamonas hypermegale]|uniref:hypothetical protein n=1 Tax=Megamonas hypermegale TaxID=158847 RepID=UPI0026F2BEEA|nr:hypothetical protein [Megamonas hypermegale]
MALKNCKHCGHEFMPIRKDHIFCSKACQKQYHYEKRKKQNDVGDLKEVECVQCHKIFKQRHKNQKYCCDECKDDYYKAWRSRWKRPKPKGKARTAMNNLDMRARRQKETGISDGKLEAFKDCPEQLQKMIRYQQEIGRAYPIDPNEKRVIGKRARS